MCNTKKEQIRKTLTQHLQCARDAVLKLGAPTATLQKELSVCKSAELHVFKRGFNRKLRRLVHKNKPLFIKYFKTTTADGTCCTLELNKTKVTYDINKSQIIKRIK